MVSVLNATEDTTVQRRFHQDALGGRAAVDLLVMGSWFGDSIRGLTPPARRFIGCLLSQLLGDFGAGNRVGESVGRGGFQP
jgi:hypothetical protein